MVETLSLAVTPVVVVAAQGQELPPMAADIIRDEYDALGPLAGIAAALTALESRTDAVYVSSCDVPLLRPGFIQRIVRALTEDVDVVVPQAQGYLHPLAAVYRVNVLAQVKELLTARRLRPVFLFETVRVNVLTSDAWQDVDHTSESLRNANTWAEYERLVGHAETWETENPADEGGVSGR
jgi:molybdopterin-guanine dinucleotide biosynthesis protein A